MNRYRIPSLVIPITAAAALLLGGCGAQSDSAGTATQMSSADASVAGGAGGGDTGGPEQSSSGSGGASASASVTATATAVAPACDASATLVQMTEGPYYTEGAPARDTLSDADTVGTPLVLTGTVYDADCQPVAGATIDVWQADGAGEYDNSGYDLRGVLTTDAQGRYSLTTVIPGIYPGRTEHIHVKVSAPGGPVYTTQLFFPGSTENEGDSIFDEAMLITVAQDGADQMLATYNFVLP